MAVIRTRRLWSRLISPGLEMESVPATPGVPTQRLPQSRKTTVYACPTGSRAIIRSVQSSLTGIPTGEEPTFNVLLEPGPGGPGGDAVDLHWFWWVDHQYQTAAQWILHDNWSCMVVLHATDQISIINTCSRAIYMSGSGHLLPEQT